MAPSGGAPNTPPNGPPPSNPISSPNLVHFDPKSVVPSQPIYVQRNDVIVVAFMNNTANTIIAVQYRWLTPDGEIKEGIFTAGPMSGIVTFSFPLFEGWLLSFTSRFITNFVSGQWTYMQAYVARGSVAGPITAISGQIWAGYIPSQLGNGYPGLPSKEITDGAGTLRTITGSTPAAGAEISESVPANRRWNVYAFTAFLTTSATVANRTPQFIIDDGVNILYVNVGITTEAASLAFRYAFTTVVPSQAFVIGSQPVAVQLPFPLKSPFRIRSLTTGIQAGDQWSAPQYLVQEWGSWD